MGRQLKKRKFSVGDAVTALMILLVGIWLVHPTIGLNLLGLGNGTGSSGQTLEQYDPDDLLQQLAELEVRPSADERQPHYERTQFGDGWQDLDGDGCNTRNEVLARDLESVDYRPRTNNCVVETGVLQDPYTDTTINFQHGKESSQLVQIDHVVALADAWDAGAWQWSSRQRIEFSNDHLNLLAVDGDANDEKAALTADEWLPTNKDYHCAFVSRQVLVKHKWDLSVTQAEAATMEEVLNNCD